jgi:predicted O-methyltransferase YrrM
MAAGFPAAAEALRRDKTAIAAEAVEAAGARDPELRGRFTDRGLGDLLHDAEMLTERLAMCLASGDTRWLPEFTEWMSPILRRRGVAQADLAAVAEGIREIASQRLEPDEQELAGRALDAAVEVLRKNGRVGGDSHKRNALLRWLYRGV